MTSSSLRALRFISISWAFKLPHFSVSSTSSTPVNVPLPEQHLLAWYTKRSAHRASTRELAKTPGAVVENVCGASLGKTTKSCHRHVTRASPHSCRIWCPGHVETLQPQLASQRSKCCERRFSSSEKPVFHLLVFVRYADLWAPVLGYFANYRGADPRLRAIRRCRHGARGMARGDEPGHKQLTCKKVWR